MIIFNYSQENGCELMKLKIEQSDEFDEIEVTIRCKTIDSRLQKAIDILQNTPKTLTVQNNGALKIIKTGLIYYIESVDEKTFVYCESEVYSSELKLYEFEELFSSISFVRISKACILNIDYIDSIRVLLNGKLEATLMNSEKVIITRHYVPMFRKKLNSM